MHCVVCGLYLSHLKNNDFPKITRSSVAEQCILLARNPVFFIVLELDLREPSITITKCQLEAFSGLPQLVSSCNQSAYTV